MEIDEKESTEPLAPAEPAPDPHRHVPLQIVLFILTVGSTMLAGGPVYAAGIVAILLFHEMGHYLAARYHGVAATLPFFIPFPLSLFGTFGAVIKMHGRIPNRKALFDIGILGPLAGVVVALPVTLFGLARSEVIRLEDLEGMTISLGDSLLFAWMTNLVVGPVPEGADVLLHPAAFAGWAGLFVTALNLLPLGQLDGGHVVHALLGRRSVRLYRIVAVAFGVFAVAYNRQWLFFLGVVLLLIGIRHPPTENDDAPIGTPRAVFGVLALLFFLVTFPPFPIRL